MLLVDPGSGVTCSRQGAAPVPYVLKNFREQALRAAGFLGRGGDLECLVPVLLQEISGLADMPPVPDARPAQVVEQIACLVAAGLVQVGERLADRATLVFWASEPTECDFGQGARFPREDVAADFLRRCLADSPSRAAVTAALAARTDATLQPPVAASDLEAWLASQLMARRLGLYLIQDDTGVLRIAWTDRHGLIPSAAPAPSPPPPPPAVAQIIQAMLSTMPDLPDTLSAQAQTMAAAAADGLPFCEECAKAAAARAAADA